MSQGSARPERLCTKHRRSSQLRMLPQCFTRPAIRHKPTKPVSGSKVRPTYVAVTGLVMGISAPQSEVDVDAVTRCVIALHEEFRRLPELLTKEVPFNLPSRLRLATCDRPQ